MAGARATRGQTLDLASAGLLRSEAVATKIDRDPIEPRAERGSAFKLLSGLKRPEETLLGHIPGVFQIAGHSVGEVCHVLIPARDQFFKRSPIALTKTFRELLIGEFHIQSCLSCRSRYSDETNWFDDEIFSNYPIVRLETS